MTEPMNEHWAFPPLVPWMIAIGIQSGSLDWMLAKVADFYEKEVDAATEQGPEMNQVDEKKNVLLCIC